ncbi:MAG: glycosyltransferase family 1 protein, partial [bacterium]
MTKVLFIITQSELGGAQRWVFDTATNLDKNRYEIVVASQPGPLLDKLREKSIKTIEISSFTR